MGKSLLILSSLLISSTIFSMTDTILKGGGKAVTKIHKQNFTKYCEATREWFEIENSPNPKAAQKITNDLKKELTVGKKLKASDCSYSSNEEADKSVQDANEVALKENKACIESRKTDCSLDLEQPVEDSYKNIASITDSSRKKVIGVETIIAKRGSNYTGFTVTYCSVYSLTDGKKYDLEKLLTPAGEDVLGKKSCAFMKKANPTAKCSSFADFKESLYSGPWFCLVEDGVDVRFGIHNNNSNSKELVLSNEELKTAFKFPKGLDLSP